jgi:hypothetical protein
MLQMLDGFKAFLAERLEVGGVFDGMNASQVGCVGVLDRQPTKRSTQGR